MGDVCSVTESLIKISSDVGILLQLAENSSSRLDKLEKRVEDELIKQQRKDITSLQQIARKCRADKMRKARIQMALKRVINSSFVDKFLLAAIPFTIGILFTILIEKLGLSDYVQYFWGLLK